MPLVFRQSFKDKPNLTLGKKEKKNRFNGRTLLWTDKFKFELLMDKFDYKVLKHAYNNSYGNCHRKLKDKTAAYCLMLTTTI